jgi:hypothetical protein
MRIAVRTLSCKAFQFLCQGEQHIGRAGPGSKDCCRQSQPERKTIKDAIIFAVEQ